MPKLSPEAMTERRNAILDAARRRFVRQGIHVSVDEICAEAGISKGAFYTHFKSKKAAIEAIATDHAQTLERLGEVQDFQSFVDRLYEFAHGGDAESSRLELEAWAYSLNEPGLHAPLQDNMLKMRLAFAHIFSSKAFGDQPHGKAAEILQIFMTGLVVRTALSRDEPKPDLKESLRELILCLSVAPSS